MIPGSFKLLFSQQQIADRVKDLGFEIALFAQEVRRSSGKDLMVIPVLRGGVFFFADLVRQIEASVEMAPAQSWAYQPDKIKVQNEQIKVQIDQVQAEGRTVLLVDDICDSGRTMQHLCEQFTNAGATEVRSAVTVHRLIDDSQYQPDWVGFEYSGDEWLVGYGMDEVQRWRNLPNIYVITDVSDHHEAGQ